MYASALTRVGSEVEEKNRKKWMKTSKKTEKKKQKKLEKRAFLFLLLYCSESLHCMSLLFFMGVCVCIYIASIPHLARY